MKKVFADRVTPRHIPPLGVEGVVLEEEMVLALIEHQAVRVICPPLFRAEMELRAQSLVV